MLDTAARVAGFSGAVVSAQAAALARQGVAEFMGPRSLPLWLQDPEWQAFMDRSSAAATTAGLTTRTLEDSVTAALAWERQLGTNRPRSRAGLSRADELAVITALTAEERAARR